MFRKRLGREKEAKIFSSKNQFTFSKLKSKEFAEELIVHKVRELMQAWFTLKGKVKKDQELPIEPFETFRCAIVIMQMILNPNVDNSLNLVCLK